MPQHTPSSGPIDVDKLPEIIQEDQPLYAMVVPGAVYDTMAELIEHSDEAHKNLGTNPEGSSRHWFNVACVKDALAQTELLGLAMPPKESPAMEKMSCAARYSYGRLPALHMLTAKYCYGRSVTVRGTSVAWRWGRRGSEPDHAHSPLVEARWNDQGAACLDHSRLWKKDKVVYVPEPVREQFDAKDRDQIMSEADFLKKACAPPKGMPPVPIPSGCSDDDSTLISYPLDHDDSDGRPAI